MASVPDDWRSAAEDGPEQDFSPLQNSGKRKLRIAPAAEKVDLVTGTIAAISMTFVAAVLWFALETRGHIVSPWLAVGMGALVAVAVRLGGTRANPEVRATLAVIVYLIGLLITIFFIERFDYILTYGFAPDFDATEGVFVRDRFTDPQTVAAWAMGVVVAVQVSYLTRKR